ncbi:GCN5 family acetyltransferase [Sphingomonas sp. Leaf24]|uniref:GNAT family N-acetyltransferase n=1 Tax=unclassified Sphingomonas TaxID=196159 RepID=UPI0006F3AED1|nr:MULTISPECIES: GNAT family N-acetyltransferase [unclassified Sphingomonas]KQM12848.1 GCN5 family acetyltransferase [Sphingomonas sp. Leaf5]KQM94485.1 GCN5 family acetyltransferase [Sphingomonas sp. Leaf24]
MGLIPVKPDEVATIVTSLEMLERPRPAPLPASSLQLVRWDKPAIDRYRALFRRIGGPWLWFSRLVMADDTLAAILHGDAVRIWAVVDRAGIEVGMLELDDRKAGECELSYVGLIPELTGQGLGRWLMAQALGLAWRKDVRRVWVHTCTLDHPGALGFYRRSGFVPYQRTIETFADPRAIGILPADGAPHYPLLANRR